MCFFVSITQLAPELPPQVTFVFHWKAITNYFIEATGINDIVEEHGLGVNGVLKTALPSKVLNESRLC